MRAIARTPRTGQISLWEKLGYGSGDLASNLAFQVIINFLQAYYTDTLLLDPARIALIFGIVRLTDAVTDPIMGGITDRTITRWGQFRPWLLWLAVPFGAAYFLAFSIGGMDDSIKSWAAFLTYFILLLAYTAINIPYGALATAITPDPDERMSLRSWQFAMAQSGNIIVGAATMPLVAMFGQGNDIRGFQFAIGIYAAISVVLFLVCFLSTRERISASGEASSANSKFMAKRNISVWQDISALLRNDQWIVLAAINFFLLIAVVMRGANTFYFTKYVLNAEPLFSVYLTLAALAAVVGSIVAGRFSGGLSIKDFIVTILIAAIVLFVLLILGKAGPVVRLPHTQILVALLSMSVGLVIAHFLGVYFDRVHAFSGLFIFQGAAQIGLGMTVSMRPEIGFSMFILSAFLGQVAVPVLWSMLSDCVDYGQKKTGIRNNGLVFSSVLFSLKLGVTAGGVIGGLILARTGYVANQAQSALALDGIVWAFAFGPAICCFVVAALSLLLKLTEKFVRSLQAELGLASVDAT